MSVTINGTTGVSQIQDGIVTPIKTQVGALPSMIRLNTTNGFGSTNTKIVRFTNTVTNQGSDITYTDSATLGAIFTINTNGVYSVSFCASTSAASVIGISLNTTQPTTSIFTITTADCLAIAGTVVGSPTANVAWTGYLPSGSVIRIHTDGGAFQATNNVFTIQRVA